MNNKKDELKLTEGSSYRILSIGGRENALETEGVFKGFASIGIDEGGIQIEMSQKHGDLQGKIRIVPLHAILAIDILDEKKDEDAEDIKEAEGLLLSKQLYTAFLNAFNQLFSFCPVDLQPASPIGVVRVNFGE